MSESLKSVSESTYIEQVENYYIKPADEDKFSSFKMGSLNHNFQHHPLMQLDKLQAMAEYLMPREQCRFVAPDIQLDSYFTHYSEATDGRGLDEFFERIQEPKFWIALYNVEAHPEYQAFVEEEIDLVRPEVERERGGIFNVGGFIFISAPPSVTPFLIDRGYKFNVGPSNMRSKRLARVSGKYPEVAELL